MYTANSSEPSSGEHSTLPCGTPDMQLDDEDCSEPTATYSSFQKYKRLQPVESDTTDAEILRDAIKECAVIDGATEMSSDRKPVVTRQSVTRERNDVIRDF